MGKTQSKRSVDITTDPKKGTEDEVTEKLEKIEDLDQQKQVNGDTTPNENNETEKKEPDESENDKDKTTEKNVADSAQATSGDTAGDQNNTTVTSNTAELPKEDATGSATKDDVTVEEISPLADESLNKKSKKEKVKKKWSFRSISFGRKDKQKPSKTEEVAENAVATNGEAEKAATEGVTDVSKPEEGASGDAVAAKPAENGKATEKELNGQKTPTPTDEKTDVTVGTETNTASSNTTANVAAAVTSTTNTTATSNNETAANVQQQQQTETKVESTTNDVVTVGATAICSNGESTEKNGIVDAVADKISELKIENKTIPCVNNGNETPHQNGTNGAEDHEHHEGGDVDQQHEKTKIEGIINVQNSISEEAQENLAQQQQQQQNQQQNQQQEEQLNGGESALIDENLIKTVVSESCDNHQQPNTPPPPPLPNSPPPSQVTMFAFKDSTQNVEDIEIKQPIVTINAAESQTGEKQLGKKFAVIQEEMSSQNTVSESPNVTEILQSDNEKESPKQRKDNDATFDEDGIEEIVEVQGISVHDFIEKWGHQNYQMIADSQENDNSENLTITDNVVIEVLKDLKSNAKSNEILQLKEKDLNKVENIKELTSVVKESAAKIKTLHEKTQNEPANEINLENVKELVNIVKETQAQVIEKVNHMLTKTEQIQIIDITKKKVDITENESKSKIIEHENEIERQVLDQENKEVIWDENTEVLKELETIEENESKVERNEHEHKEESVEFENKKKRIEHENIEELMEIESKKRKIEHENSEALIDLENKEIVIDEKLVVVEQDSKDKEQLSNIEINQISREIENKEIIEKVETESSSNINANVVADSALTEKLVHKIEQQEETHAKGDDNDSIDELAEKAVKILEEHIEQGEHGYGKKFIIDLHDDSSDGDDAEANSHFDRKNDSTTLQASENLSKTTATETPPPTPAVNENILVQGLENSKQSLVTPTDEYEESIWNLSRKIDDLSFDNTNLDIDAKEQQDEKLRQNQQQQKQQQH